MRASSQFEHQTTKVSSHIKNYLVAWKHIGIFLHYYKIEPYTHITMFLSTYSNCLHTVLIFSKVQNVYLDQSNNSWTMIQSIQANNMSSIMFSINKAGQVSNFFQLVIF